MSEQMEISALLGQTFGVTNGNYFARPQLTINIDKVERGFEAAAAGTYQETIAAARNDRPEPALVDFKLPGRPLGGVGELTPGPYHPSPARVERG